MDRKPPVSLIALATAVLMGAASPAAHAAPCSAFANQRLVFLLQGQVRSADGQADVAKSVIGRLSFDASGRNGSFSLAFNGGDPAQTGQQQGSFTCAPTRPLAGLAPQLSLSNGLNLLALRERHFVQLLVNDPHTAMAGEARPAAAWDTLPQGACDLLAGRVYSGRYGSSSDGQGLMGLTQWRFDTAPAQLQTWSAGTGGNGATALNRTMGACVPWAPDQAALLPVSNGNDGTLLAFPAADGSMAWIHTYPGRGVGGWLRQR